jgi:hypothetical protein
MPLLQILTDPQNFRFYAGGRGHVSNATSFGQKSIPYGDDTKGGGSSNQPYIKSPIPDELTANPSDYILRGGLLNNAQTSAQDVSRLTQMFTDTKSTNGLFFTLKQQQLSATAVRTQASPSFGLNGQLYSPLNTLAQAGVVSQGIHLNKQGINPFAETGAYAQGEYLYFNKVKPNPNDPSGSLESNRLVSLFEAVNENRSISNWNFSGVNLNVGDNDILSYRGGPGSVLGVGTTNIRFADQRTGNNNPLKVSNPVYFLTGSRWVDRTRGSWISPVTNGASGKYEDYTGKIGSLIFNNNGPVITPDGGYTFNPNFYYNVYKPGTLTPDTEVTGSQKILKSVLNNNQPKAEGGLKINPEKPWTKSPQYGLPATNVNTPQTSSFAYSNTGIINGVNGALPQNVYTYSKTLIEKPGKDNTDVNLPTGNHLSPKTQDFRAVLRNNLRGQDKKNADQLGATAKSLSYDIGDNLTIEYRTNLGDPGAREGKSYFSYTAGVQGGGRSGQPLDKINALKVYSSNNGPTIDGSTNDLIAFRIGAINNINPKIVDYIHFRAFLNSFTDSYTGDWSGYNYLGRGEKFYTYNGFDRKLSLGFTAAAQSKEELIPMYKKLNFLASNLAPDYSGEYGYMKGCFVTLTVGGYLYEQPGFITNLSYDMITEMPWEIGINDTNGEQDPSVKQLSHMVKINSFDFTPIHNFIPSKQDVGLGENNETLIGDQEYIALANPNNGSSNWSSLGSINALSNT